MPLMQDDCTIKTGGEVTGGVTVQVKNSSLVKNASSGNTINTRLEGDL
jgi:hypothetical protein